MSNTKQVQIYGTVPFNWLDKELQLGDGTMGPGQKGGDLAWLGQVFLSPGMGLHLDYTYGGMKPNNHHGETATYNFSITGTEAVPPSFLEMVIRMVQKVGGIVYKADVIDLDDGNRHYDYLLNPSMEKGA
jgi:hypothetical protein